MEKTKIMKRILKSQPKAVFQFGFFFQISGKNKKNYLYENLIKVKKFTSLRAIPYSPLFNCGCVVD
jgi:hypothetical protein